MEIDKEPQEQQENSELEVVNDTEMNLPIPETVEISVSEHKELQEIKELSLVLLSVNEKLRAEKQEMIDDFKQVAAFIQDKFNFQESPMKAIGKLTTMITNSEKMEKEFQPVIDVIKKYSNG